MHSLARAMMPALRAPDEVNQLYVDYVSLAFHAHLMSHYAGPSPDRRQPRPGLSCWQARVSAELIASRLNGKVSVAELAALCNLSQSHYSRAFVQTFGMPPHRWLLERRVESAKSLIELGTMTLPDVASNAGFASQSHLSRVFSGVTGTTPGKWRRMATRTATRIEDDSDI
jgi:AraC-like DNA-binding protein